MRRKKPKDILFITYRKAVNAHIWEALTKKLSVYWPIDSYFQFWVPGLSVGM